MPLIIPSNSITGGYEVANSLRFNDGSSDSLNRTFGTPSNNKIHTTSVWFKRSSGLGVNQSITYVEQGGGYARILLHNSDAIIIDGADSSGGNSYGLTTSRLFRDVSAWYHIVVAFDDTQSTASNRLKLYVNGVQETSFSSETYPTQNIDYPYNSANAHYIGRNTAGATYYDGYLAEYCFIDGTQNAVTDFGEFDEDSGIWKPIDVSGLTFGTNGFYLDFENSGSLGADVSGNGNNFTVNNLTAIDQTTDTPTNNFATLNALAKGSSSTFSEGNLKNTTGGAYNTSTSTIGVSSGKWYWEYKLPASSLNYVLYGITSLEFDGRNTDVMTNFKTSYSKTAYANEFRYNTTGGAYSTDTSGFSTDSTGDIVKIALDLDNNFIYVGNGSSWFNSGNPESGASGTGASKSVVAGLTYFPMMITLTNSMEINFGSPPYSESGGNSDGNGYGNFNQAVPSGYLSLCSANLSEVLG